MAENILVTTSFRIGIGLFSSFVFLIAIYLAWMFPLASIPLLLSLCLYAIALWFYPLIWLYILPVLTVALNLTPWSGRPILTELDMFILVTISIVVLRSKQFTTKNPSSLFLPIIFTIFCLFSLKNISLSEILSPLTTNFYFSSLLSFSIVKGIVWGLGLAWLFRLQSMAYQEKTISSLLNGFLITSIIMFLIILWERNTLTQLLNNGLSISFFHSFLNFTSAYRATGIISDMHTGGESFDGILLILAPMNLLAFYYSSNHRQKLFSILGLLCILYCVLVGFTRATYAAVAISLFSLFIMHYIYQHMTKDKEHKTISKASRLREFLLYIIYILSVWMAYSLAGFYAIGAGGFLLLSISLLCHIKFKFVSIFWILLIILNVSTVLICVDSFYDSHWVESTDENRFNLIMSLFGIVLSCNNLLWAFKQSKQKLSDNIYKSLSVIVISAILTLALGSTRIQMRSENTIKDFSTRMEHWQNVISSSNWTTSEILFGNGLGSFPFNYLITNTKKVNKIGSFNIETKGTNNTLLLGAGSDLAFGQRVKITPNTKYNILLNLQSDSKAHILFSLCARNLIVAERWGGDCQTIKKIIPKTEGFTDFSIPINSSDLSKSPWFKRLPSVFLIRYGQGKTALKFNKIQLINEKEVSVLNNEGFDKGMDFWFFYYDFEHLAWHIKNIYLSVFYQLGVLGSILFSLLILVGIKRIIFSEPDLRLLYIGFMSMVIGYLAFGLFGDPLDSARASSLFFMLLFLLASGFKNKPDKKLNDQS